MSDQPPSAPYGSPEPPHQAGQSGPYSPYGQPGAAGSYGQAPYGYGYGYGLQQDHGGATTSMVLGISSIAVAVIGLSCYGVISWIGAVLGPIALVKARSAMAEINADPARYKNRGMATTGQITGIIGTALGALALIGIIVVVVIIIVTALSQP